MRWRRRWRSFSGNDAPACRTPIRRSADPPIRRSDPGIPDDFERIILSEIRKELRALKREQELPFDVESSDDDRRRTEGARDPSRPTLCARLDELACMGARPVEFRRLVRKACAILVDDFAAPGTRRGRKWTLEPGWLFRRAYLEELPCAEIAVRTGHPARSVVEILRRLSARLEAVLLPALVLPLALVAAIRAGAPVTERDREVVRDALRSFLPDEGGEISGAGQPIP